MTLKLKLIDGMVQYLEDTGATMISRLTSPEKAEQMIDNAKSCVKVTVYTGYNLCVDGKYYFTTVHAGGRKKVEE